MNVMEQQLQDVLPRYEILLIQKTEDLSKVKQALAKYKAEILVEKPLEKVKLAYPIQKETMFFMGTIEFSLAPEHVASLQADMKLDDNLVRSTVSRATVKVERKPQQERPSSAPRRFLGRFKKAVEPILTNEALEKKIEEISQ